MIEQMSPPESPESSESPRLPELSEEDVRLARLLAQEGWTDKSIELLTRWEDAQGEAADASADPLGSRMPFPIRLALLYYEAGFATQAIMAIDEAETLADNSRNEDLRKILVKKRNEWLKEKGWHRLTPLGNIFIIEIKNDETGPSAGAGPTTRFEVRLADSSSHEEISPKNCSLEKIDKAIRMARHLSRDDFKKILEQKKQEWVDLMAKKYT